VGVVPVAFLVTLAGIGVNSFVNPAMPEISAALGLTDVQAGLVVGAASLPGVVMAPVAGILADRYGRRHVLVPSLVLFSVAGGLGSFATGFWTLFPLRVLQGIGGAALINLAVTIIADAFEGPERARWIGRNSIVLTFGLAVFPIAGGLLAEIDWRLVFVPFWLGLVVAWMTLRRLPHDRPGRVESLSAQLRGALGQAKTLRAGVLYATGFVIFTLIFAVILFALPFLLADHFGLSPGWIAAYLGVDAVVAGILSSMTERLYTSFSTAALMLAGFVLLGAGYAILAVAGSSWVLVAGIVLSGAGEGLTIPILQTVSTELGSDEHRGALIAFWVGTSRLGQTTGPVLAGVGQNYLGLRQTIAGASILAFSWAGLSGILFRRAGRGEAAADA